MIKIISIFMSSICHQYHIDKDMWHLSKYKSEDRLRLMIHSGPPATLPAELRQTKL